MSNQNYSELAGMEYQKIDLIYYISEIWKKFKRLWWLAVLMALILGGFSFLRFDRTYNPYYKTSITAYVEMSAEKSDSYQNQLTAAQMEKVFPYLLENGLLEDAILDYMGIETMPGNVSMSADPYSNLLTFTCTGDDPEAIHQMVIAVVDVFPKTISYIVGPTVFKTFKDMGVPKEPANSPPTLRNAITFSVKKGIYGFMAGLIIIAIFGALNQTIGTNKQLKQIVNKPVLGIIPLTKRTRRRPYALVDDEKTSELFIESFRSFRNRFEREAKGNKVFMITSTVPNEGKSTVSVNLALSLAAKGRKVLLIDSDMRNPSIDTMLGLKAEIGLHDVLRDKCKLEQAIVRLSDQGLYVLPAGKPTKHSADLLYSSKMKELLDQVRDLSDYTLIDTPPVMVLSDTKAMASLVDRCIYVVNKETARIPAILNNIEQLSEAGVELVGTVFNSSSGEEGGYSRSGKYGGYGKYGKYGMYGRYGRSGYYGVDKKKR